jgi:hypothetical protein
MPAKKKKAAYFQNKGKAPSAPPKGSRGLLVTCDVARVNEALRQVLRICEEILDRVSVDPSQEISFDDELVQLRTPVEKGRFIPYISEVPGNFFIRFTDERDDPFVLVDRYYRSMRESGSSATTRVTRLYPIKTSGSPEAEQSLPVLQGLVEGFFGRDRPVKYEVVLQRKYKGVGQKESHDELNEKIRKLVGEPHQAVYHGGDVAVLWLSLGKMLYLSIVEQWKEWCGCNVPKFCAQLQLPES